MAPSLKPRVYDRKTWPDDCTGRARLCEPNNGKPFPTTMRVCCRASSSSSSRLSAVKFQSPECIARHMHCIMFGSNTWQGMYEYGWLPSGCQAASQRSPQRTNCRRWCDTRSTVLARVAYSVIRAAGLCNLCTQGSGRILENPLVAKLGQDVASTAGRPNEFSVTGASRPTRLAIIAANNARGGGCRYGTSIGCVAAAKAAVLTRRRCEIV
jgi:hypothetical protein